MAIKFTKFAVRKKQLLNNIEHYKYHSCRMIKFISLIIAIMFHVFVVICTQCKAHVFL